MGVLITGLKSGSLKTEILNTGSSLKVETNFNDKDNSKKTNPTLPKDTIVSVNSAVWDNPKIINDLSVISTVSTDEYIKRNIKPSAKDFQNFINDINLPDETIADASQWFQYAPLNGKKATLIDVFNCIVTKDPNLMELLVQYGEEPNHISYVTLENIESMHNPHTKVGEIKYSVKLMHDDGIHNTYSMTVEIMRVNTGSFQYTISDISEINYKFS